MIAIIIISPRLSMNRRSRHCSSANFSSATPKKPGLLPAEKFRFRHWKSSPKPHRWHDRGNPPRCPHGSRPSASRILEASERRISPVLNLGRRDGSFGLMRIERSGIGGPALGQDLERKQLGFGFGLERPGGSDRPCGPAIGFYGLVGPKGHIPGVRLRHAASTRIVAKSFIHGHRRQNSLWRAIE